MLISAIAIGRIKLIWKEKRNESQMTEDAYPLSWPTGKPRCRSPERSRFDVSFGRARDEIIREVKLLGGSLPVLSTNIPVKRDGFPYAGQKEPKDTGVAVYFVLKNQQFCFACDRWNRVGDNLQAIRHTIAALRGIERWGTGDMVQQAFTGFIALPSQDNPYDVLGVKPSASTEEIEASYRQKAKLLHPDVGGSPEAMQKLNDARKRLHGAA